MGAVSPAVSATRIEPLQWSSSFELGVKTIDDEHRELFDHVLRLYDAAEQQDLLACAGLASDFLAAAQDHFEKEEAFLERIGYPKTGEHKIFHEQLTSQLREMTTVCHSDAEVTDIWRCYSSVLALLIDDIVRGDSKFKSYLQHNGYS